MLCSWIVVVISVAAISYLRWYKNTVRQGFIVGHVCNTLYTVFLLSAAAVNIYMFKKLRKNDGLADSHQSTGVIPQANAQQRSMHLKRKASKLVLLLAVIMIVTCFPMATWYLITDICYVYKLHCNLYANLTMWNIILLLQDLNFIVNPLVYIWKDRIYRNAFYRTFKIKTAQF